MTRRVLMISPHFPPDASAGAHRVRLLAPHLAGCGWEPTVLTVDPRDLETRLDPELAALVPTNLRVVRCRAWPARRTRPFGVGDLGLRAWHGLWRASRDLLERERFDALFITIYPTYPALLGPALKRRHRVPFVLDYQDPWVGEWGRSAGSGPAAGPDLKSRLTRALAVRLEPIAVRAADALTAVSQRTYEDVLARVSLRAAIPCATIPIGAEPADFSALADPSWRNPHFDPADGAVHLCAVGTLLPLAVETLRAVLAALARVRAARPDLAGRLRLHFFGTSNQTDLSAAPRVLPMARALGLADAVTEVAPRLSYGDAIRVQQQASGLLLIGSCEPHYTASRLYPSLLARRPLLAVYHEASSVVEILARSTRPPNAHVVTFGDGAPVAAQVGAIAGALEQLADDPRYDDAAVDADALAPFSAAALAGTLAAILDRVAHR